MKIGLELQPIAKSKSGIGWYTYELIQSMVHLENEHSFEMNHSETLQFEGYLFNFLNRNHVDRSLECDRLSIRVNRMMPYGVYCRAWRLIPFSYNFIMGTKAPLFHFFNFIVPPFIRGKVVVSVYDMVSRLFPETMTAANRRRLERDLQRSVARADLVVAISESSKQDIMRFLHVPESKMAIVSPGIDLERYCTRTDAMVADEARIRERYRLPAQYALYLGTLEPRKNIPTILRAYAAFRSDHPEVKLVLAGGRGWMFDEIQSVLESLQLGEDVILPGYVEEADKPHIYRMSSLFLFPSLYEGFGMPVLEAMACGVPVIASNVSSIPEVAGDAAILTDPMDTNAICSAMTRVLADDVLRKAMIVKGLRRAPLFTWEKSASVLLALYRQLLEGAN